MSFPVIHEITQTSSTADATSYNASLPATVNAGDLLILITNAQGDDDDPTTPAGWTEISSQGSNNNFMSNVFVKKADGTEDGTTVTIDYLATNTMLSFSAQCYRIQVGTWRDSGTIANDVQGTVTISTTTNPDPPTFNPSAWGSEDTMWITVLAAGQDQTQSASPNNYTNVTTTDPTSGVGNRAYLVTARRELNIDSEDPTTWTAGNSAWARYTLAVRPSAVALPEFPSVRATATTTFNVSDTAHSVNMPTCATNDLLVAMVMAGGAASTFTTPSGWTSIGQVTTGTVRLGVFAKKSDGTESLGAVGFTTNVATLVAAHVRSITGWKDSGTLTNDIEVATASDAGTATPDPPSLDPVAWATEKTLWFAVCARNNLHNVITYPTGFTGGIQSKGNAFGSNIASAQKNDEVGAEDPGTFQWDGSVANVLATVGIRPGTQGGGTPQVNPRRGQVYFIEMQYPPVAGGAPTDPRRGQVYWLELEYPDAARRGQVYSIELEYPDLGLGSFPVVADVTQTSSVADATNYATNYPAVVTANDLLICVAIGKGLVNAGTVISSAGWTRLAGAGSNGNYHLGVLVKKAVGNEDGTTFTVDFVNAATGYCAQVYRIPTGAWRNSGTITADVECTLTGQQGTSNCPSLNPAAWGTENTLWIAVTGFNADATASAGPSGYTNLVTTDETAGGSAYLATARSTHTIDVEDPGTFTTVGSITNFGVATIAVRPAASGAGGGPSDNVWLSSTRGSWLRGL